MAAKPAPIPKTLADAVAAHRRGDLDAAERSYRAILRAEPRHFDATQLLGALLHMRGSHKEAGLLLRRAAALDPSVAAVHNNLGNAVRAQGQAEESLAHFDRAVALDADYADAYNNRANVLNDLGRYPEALADYDRALARNPLQRNALQKSAKLLADIARFDEALARNARALAAGTPTVDVYLRSGNVLLLAKRPDEALAAYDRAVALDPENAQAAINRCAALEALGRSGEALAQFDLALAAKPDHAELLAGKATVLRSLNRVDESCEFYRRALALAPGDAEANTNHAMALLSKGDFDAGWRAYEHRWNRKGTFARRPALAFAVWDGEALQGRSILVHAEQGLGDVVQFSRYLPLLGTQGAEVGFLAPAKLHALLRAAFPDVRLFAEAAEVPAFDFQCAMMSLPRHFDGVPAAVPYLKADGERVARWRETVGTHGFRIGISWQGNPTAHVDPGRGVPLAAFAPLAAIPGVRLVSLQKNDGVAQLDGAPLAVETLGAAFDSGPDAFVDTLAVMACLDLVISSDTSVAHVAGALGRPVWTALKFAADWRWLLAREDCPWYPTMRLFRQAAPGDWPGVIAGMAALIPR